MATAAFAAGAEVVLTGLQSAPTLNGARGVLLRYDDAAERWHVRLADGQKKNVREVNLRAAAAGGARAANNLNKWRPTREREREMMPAR